MKVVVNGQARQMKDGTTVAEIVRAHGVRPDGTGVAVALNGDVVRRAEWSSVRVNEDDHVELLRAIGGGGT